MLNRYLDIAPEVKKALDEGKPVVALESTIISHGMPLSLIHILHPIGVRHTDNAAHLHILVGIQNILDLTGIHIVARGDDPVSYTHLKSLQAVDRRPEK